MDRDPGAPALAGRRLAAYADRTRLVNAVYDQIADVLAELGLPRVDGILFDLGVSSPQIDEPARGFSLRADGPLDMRMDPTGATTGADVLNHAAEVALAALFRDRADERRARPLARAVIRRRRRRP